MILTAKTEGAFCVAANLHGSHVLGGWTVNVDQDQLFLLDPEDYEETCGLTERAWANAA